MSKNIHCIYLFICMRDRGVKKNRKRNTEYQKTNIYQKRIKLSMCVCMSFSATDQD